MAACRQACTLSVQAVTIFSSCQLSKYSVQKYGGSAWSWTKIQHFQASTPQSQSSKHCCHQMSDFKAKMHQIRFRLGLRPRPRWGSLQYDPPTAFWTNRTLVIVMGNSGNSCVFNFAIVLKSRKLDAREIFMFYSICYCQMQQSHTINNILSIQLPRKTALYIIEHKEPVATKHNTQISTGIELLYTSARFTTML